ncbi:glycerophosphodiester phosphodiesterase family protein [Brevibacterium sp. 2SA]|uniref:glycerophosphodiester phosphodiesterase family protein n=1 Tax=Brevibacterium sp. 2SA TaxID=2502198 RepID=UPI0010F94657|nr:glycerophosphodiester phosphodiesterase family protein [Brevibacterium sp. 2SA]
MNSQPEIIAHRGGLWPGTSENTLTAFTAAWDAGITWMETDVHASADGVLFAAHDADLRRIADCPHLIRDLLADELDAIDLVDGGRLPRLGELVDALPGAKWNIDVKAPESIAAMVRFVLVRGIEDSLRLASFSDATLRRLRASLPGVATSAGTGETARFLLGVLPGFPTRGLLELAPDLDAFQVPMRWKGVPIVTRSFVDRAHRLGLEVHVWTINDAADMRTLAGLGVDAIVTDDVPLAQATLG